MTEEMVEVELDLDDDMLLQLAMIAHEQDITLNQLINEMLTDFIKEQDNGTSNN